MVDWAAIQQFQKAYTYLIKNKKSAIAIPENISNLAHVVGLHQKEGASFPTLMQDNQISGLPYATLFESVQNQNVKPVFHATLDDRNEIKTIFFHPEVQKKAYFNLEMLEEIQNAIPNLSIYSVTGSDDRIPLHDIFFSESSFLKDTSTEKGEAILVYQIDDKLYMPFIKRGVKPTGNPKQDVALLEIKVQGTSHSHKDILVKLPGMDEYRDLTKNMSLTGWTPYVQGGISKEVFFDIKHTKYRNSLSIETH